MRFKNKKSVALVLSGGGIKAAAFHIGVCLALEEKGFSFRGGLKNEGPEPASQDLSISNFVGSSAGAVISTFLASGYSVDDLIMAFEMGIKKRSRPSQKLKPLTYWDIFALNSPGFLRAIPSKFRTKSLVTGGFESFLKNGFKLNGLFSTRGLEKYLRTNILPTNSFKELRGGLYIVATQLNGVKKGIFGPFDSDSADDQNLRFSSASISDAVAASTALPPVYCPYGIKNINEELVYFYDGEIRDTLSTHVAVDAGADLVIASYSIQPYSYNKSMGSLHKYGIPVIANQALYQVVEQKVLKNRKYIEDVGAIYKAVDGYFKEQNLSEEHREKLLKIIADKVDYKKDVDTIYIHPNPQDYEMFFVDHFSLNKDILERIVKIGFKSALKVLRKYDL